MKKLNDKQIDYAFEDYSGTKRYIVAHPDYRNSCTVAAPDENSAIVAASRFWGKKWTDYNFYAFCTVLRQ